MKVFIIIICFILSFVVYNNIFLIEYIKRLDGLYGHMTAVERVNLKMSKYMGDCWRQYEDKTGKEYQQEVDGGWFNDELQNHKQAQREKK